MVEIVLAESAWQDFDDITIYIAKDSPRYAQEFGNKVFDRIDQLREFPLSGRMVPEYNNEYLRELIHGKYRIVYRIQSNIQIAILRIIHGSRLLDYR